MSTGSPGIGFGGISGNILVSVGEDASTETDHRSYACRILQEVPTIDGLAECFIVRRIPIWKELLLPEFRTSHIKLRGSSSKAVEGK
jgi:hypothetical protein